MPPVGYTALRRACSIACLASTLILPAAAAAQAVQGVGDNAMVLPAGTLRIRAVTQWSRFYERYGKDGSLKPLGVDFTIDTVGASQFENLGPLQTGIRALSGLSTFTASLGKTVTQIRDNVLTTPLTIEMGLTRRLSFGVVIPIVTATSDVDFRVNPAGATPTLGFNPTMAATSAITANGTLLAEFDSASSKLNQRLTFCATSPAAPGCAATNANAANAQALIQAANAFATGMGQIYGGRNGAIGSRFVPLVGTSAQAAIEARVAAFKTQFAAFGNGSIVDTGPIGAQAPLTVADAQRILTDSVFGIKAKPLASHKTRGIGDIDIGLKLNLFDSFHDDQNARLAPTGFNWRQSVGLVYRLGTGSLASPDDFTGLGTGNHQNDVELRSFTDLLYGARFWVSLIARYNMQLADEQIMRITDTPHQPAAAYREQRVHRDLGDVLEFEMNPRWTLNDYIGLMGQYYYRYKATDRYTGMFTTTNLAGTTVTLDASTLDLETEAREHRFGGGVSFSTVAASEKGKATVPFEITYYHFQTVSGAGGNVPKVTQDQVQMRVYLRWFGH